MKLNGLLPMKYKLRRLPYKETPETRAYAEAIEKGRYSQFVIESKKGWLIKNHDPNQKPEYYPSLAEAKEVAKKLAKKHKAEVFVFNEDAKIIERFRVE